jgi:hypothetical protein
MGAEEMFYSLDPRKICVLAGDIPAGYWELHGCIMERSPSLFKETETGPANKLDLDQAIARVEMKAIKDGNPAASLVSVGVGALAGLRFFGPLGAVGGALVGQALAGNRHEVTVDVHLSDGRHFEAFMDKQIYQRLQTIAGRDKSGEET